MQTGRSLLLSCGLPRLEARMLLEFVTQRPREWLLAHDMDPLAAEQAADFLSLAARRRQGVPMAHLVGHREFMGHVLAVSPDVLIPRPETELLVSTALLCLPEHSAGSVLDLGTGSGAVASRLALARPAARVTATDSSAAALAVAQKNAQAHGVRIQFWEGNWYEALPVEGRFDVIVSNPPYIAHDDPHLLQGDLRFEPASALTDGVDGLTALRQIIVGSRTRLNSGGALWVEHGFEQGPAVAQLFMSAGFHQVETKLDLAGLPRVTGGSF